ncbi:MAG: ATP synthase F1 subunit delta [Patescibacteria group bacterium]|jgi:F-type H+-transporting ATPase subunit delta
MKISAKKYAISLFEAVQDLDHKQADKVIKKFVLVLAKNQALSLAPKIIEEFENYSRQKQGIQKVEIKTARPLSKSDEKEITSQLKKRLGKEIQAEKIVDESLIGGMIIKIGDNLIDGSIKMQLINLKNNLINN